MDTGSPNRALDRSIMGVSSIIGEGRQRMRVRLRRYEQIRDSTQIAQRLDELAERAQTLGYAVTREADGAGRGEWTWGARWCGTGPVSKGFSRSRLTVRTARNKGEAPDSTAGFEAL